MEENGFEEVVSIKTAQEAILYIEKHLDEKITPLEIAKHLYISVSTMNIVFRAVCNMSVMEYIRNRRLSLAGQELLCKDTKVIDLAYQYGYETPEAFTKAFTRFYGFPPSFVRRAKPKMKVFYPIDIRVELFGGWTGSKEDKNLSNANFAGQENNNGKCYDVPIKKQGGNTMGAMKQIQTCDMKQQEDWKLLKKLAKELGEKKLLFKVDGKTMIFAHGLEFELEKVCLTFLWDDEEKVKQFFGETTETIHQFTGFKYVDTLYQGKKIRCMFYGECDEYDTEEFLYRNAEPVLVDDQKLMVQTLEFYLANAAPDDTYYKMVENYINK